MAEIKKNEIAEKNLLEGFNKDLKGGLDWIKQFNKGLEKTINLQGKLQKEGRKDTSSAGLKKQAESYKQVDNAIDKLNATRKEEKRIEKELKSIRLAELKLTKDRERAFDKFEKQQQKNIKTAQKARKQTIDSANAFKKLSKQTNAAQARFKRLAAQYGVTSKAAINAGNTFRKLDDRLRKINKSARDGRRDVGRYGLALQKVRGSLSTGLGALGITAGIAGLGRVIGNVIGVFSGFQKSNSQLQAVLGDAGTKGNMDLLKQSAKELGATTAFTASEVTGLQIEFAKLGFDPKSIDNATEATLALAAAAGVDLAEAASVAGATLGGFGLDAAETGRVTDVMAKSFSISALDMEKFKESMKSAAPAAKAVGVNVEKTTALLGTLANAGISGSKAGNNLKTTFINLNAAGLTLEEGLEKVANSEDKLGTAAKLVGKNAAASFLVLADGVDTTKQLEEGLNNAAGAAQDMADIQLDNLAGSITILGSAWEGFILSLEDGEGKFSNLLRTIVDVATELLSMATGTAKAADELDEAGRRVRNIANAIKVLAKIVGALLVSFIAYKATVKAINIATKLYTLTTNALRIAQVALKGGLKGATKAMKGFNTASKANIIGALVALLALAVTAYYAFRDAAKEAADAERDRQAAVAEGEAQQKSIEDRIKILTQLNKAQLVTLLSNIESRKEQLKIDEQVTENLLRQAELKKILEEGSAGIETDPLTGEEIDLAPFLEEELRLNVEITDALNDKTNALEEQRIVVQKRLDQLNKQLGLSKKTSEATSSEVKVIRDLIKIREDQLKRTRDLVAVNEVDIIAREKKIAIIETEIKRLKELGIEKEKQSKLDQDKDLLSGDNIFNAILAERAQGIIDAEEDEKIARELRKKELIRQAEFELALLTEGSDEATLIKIKLQNDLAAIDREIIKSNEGVLDSEKDLQKQRENINDTRIQSAKNLANILGTIAGDDEEAQKIVQALKKTLAITEIVINSNREISAIRAEEGGNETLKRAKVFQARTAAAAGILAVGSAFDGVDDTGGRGNIDSKGGKHWVLHPNEQVHSLKDRQGMADPLTGKLRTRDEIRDRVNFADNLMMSPHSFKRLESGNILKPNEIDFKKMISEQQASTKIIKKAIEDNKSTTKTYWNQHGEAVTEEIRKGILNRYTYKHRRV